MKEVTVKFGPANSCTLSFNDSATAGSVATDPRVRAALRSPENPRMLLECLEVDASTPVEDGDELTLETRASVKGN